MPIQSLGYLGVRSDRIDDWKYFAGKVLAMQLADRGGSQLSFRMDDLVQRLIISDEPGETLAFIGWEVEKKPDLQYLAEIEKKYKLDLWKIIYSDIHFYNYNGYYKFTYDEILVIIEQECKFFEKVLDEFTKDNIGKVKIFISQMIKAQQNE